MIRKKDDPFSVYSPSLERKKKPVKGPNLDWEESSFEDAENPEEYTGVSVSKSSIYMALVILFAIFAGLAWRLAYLQISKGKYYAALARGNNTRVQEILAPRGIIYDSQGTALVQNVPSFELVLTPVDLPKNYTGEVNTLAGLVGFDSNAVFTQIKKHGLNTFQAISIVDNMPRTTALIFSSRQNEFPGFSIENNPVRNYINSDIFSHLLGYTGKINDAELAAHKNDNYLLDDYIGKNGLEYTYEKYLRGVDGQKQVEVDALGKIKSVLGEIPPQNGDNVYLNIDAGLQEFLYNDIVSKNGDKKAAAVAVDPQTGQVLALVSVPGYDNNLFSQGISEAQYQKLVNDPSQPLFNRAISGLYPPGSTIKPVIASAALQEGVVSPNTKILDNGDLVVGRFHFRGWKAGGLGYMDIRSAIAMSSDIYFYTVGGGQQNLGISGLGPELIAKYDALFGMGQKLGIDLPGESAGVIASPEWRKQHFSDPARQAWYLGDTYHESIGQGDMEVTPLQDVMWTSAIANGGTLYRPYIVNKILDNNGSVILQKEPAIINTAFIDPKNIQIVREGMRQTVTSGTARSLNSLPITAAGKTGTAQFDGANPAAAHAWFTAFAPYENPQIAIVVLIEAGGEGSSVSEPIVKDALQWWAQNRFLKANPNYVKPH